MWAMFWIQNNSQKHIVLIMNINKTSYLYNNCHSFKNAVVQSYGALSEKMYPLASSISSLKTFASHLTQRTVSNCKETFPKLDMNKTGKIAGYTFLCLFAGKILHSEWNRQTQANHLQDLCEKQVDSLGISTIHSANFLEMGNCLDRKLDSLTSLPSSTKTHVQHKAFEYYHRAAEMGNPEALEKMEDYLQMLYLKASLNVKGNAEQLQLIIAEALELAVKGDRASYFLLQHIFEEYRKAIKEQKKSISQTQTIEDKYQDAFNRVKDLVYLNNSQEFEKARTFLLDWYKDPKTVNFVCNLQNFAVTAAVITNPEIQNIHFSLQSIFNAREEKIRNLTPPLYSDAVFSKIIYRIYAHHEMQKDLDPKSKSITELLSNLYAQANLP